MLIFETTSLSSVNTFFSLTEHLIHLATEPWIDSERTVSSEEWPRVKVKASYFWIRLQRLCPFFGNCGKQFSKEHLLVITMWVSVVLCLIFLCTATHGNLNCTNAHKLWQPHSTLEWGRKSSLRCCILCKSAAVINVRYRSSMLPKLLPGSQPVSWFKLCTTWDWEGVRLYSGCL